MQIGGLYTIDFAKVSKIPKFTVNIKNGDIKRTIKFVLLKNNKVLNLSNYNIVIAAKKEDNNHIFNNVKIIDPSNGLCEVDISEQMLVLNTNLFCEIILYGTDGTVASSSDFIINSLSSVRNEMNIESSNEFRALRDAMRFVANINIKMNRGESISPYQIDKNKGKFDQTFLSDELLQQIAGKSPINTVPADKSITTMKLADNCVDSKKRTNIGEFCIFMPNDITKNINIDFSNKTVYIPTGYILHRGKRIKTNETLLNYNLDHGAMIAICFNIDMNNFTVRPHYSSEKTFSGEMDLYLFAFIHNINYVQGIGSIFRINDEVPKNLKIEKDMLGFKEIFYVSTGGSDSNSGSKESPFKTFNKAIKSGAKTIIADPGEYWGQQIIANNLEKLHILINQESASPTNSYIYLKNGDGLVFKLDNSTKLYKCNRTFNKNSRFHRVFITKELPPIEVGERSNGVNACIWETFQDYKKDKTLIPTLTLDECKSKQSTFFYDGESIYLNPTDSTIDNKVYRTPIEEGSLLNLVSINDLALENIKAEFSYETVATLYNNNNMTVRNCEFSYSALGEGVQPKKSNGNFYKCIAKKNRNDGFNIQTFGDTHFFDCEAMYNFDDGISHHTGCTGSIHGGEFYENGKGGISPAHGAKIDLFNTICHNNKYGIYSVSTNNNYLGTKVRHINNICYDNEVGLQLINYHVLSYNCKYTNNKTHKQVSNNINTSLKEL